VGEAFEEPDVVGVALSMRAKEDVLSVWLRDSSNALAKIKLGCPSLYVRTMSAIYKGYNIIP
jgi:hypothetical protein